MGSLHLPALARPAPHASATPAARPSSNCIVDKELERLRRRRSHPVPGVPGDRQSDPWWPGSTSSTAALLGRACGSHSKLRYSHAYARMRAAEAFLLASSLATRRDVEGNGAQVPAPRSRGKVSSARSDLGSICSLVKQAIDKGLPDRSSLIQGDGIGVGQCLIDLIEGWGMAIRSHAHPPRNEEGPNR